MSVNCELLEDKQEEAWDAFVHSRPDATFFHQAAWRHVIASAFRHVPHYLVARRDGTITGILPLVHLRTRLFGNFLVSNPFCVYGGPLAADAESAAALENAAAILMTKTGARFCEFRFRDEPTSAWTAGPELYATFRKRIEKSDEANLKLIPRKQRAVVRKGIDSGLTSAVSRDGDAFFRLYAESVRNLGTPVFPRRYFRLLLDAFPNCAEVLTVEEEGRPVCGVLSFVFRNEILPYYAGGGKEARGLGGHDFMYWEVIRRAAQRGLEVFDFGRSKVGTGAYAFKKNWGFAPQTLHYRYKLAPGSAPPEHNPLNPKYRMLIAAWKRLPLPIANLIGPHIVRGIG